MSERDMRQRVVQVLRPLHALAVENPANPGTPDVNYVEGWIELKWLREWPIRPETVVELDHFTPQQRVFLHRRSVAGGAVWLLLQCRHEWLLFLGDVAAQHVGKVPRADLFRLAHAVWYDGLKEDSFIKCVSQHPSKSSSRAAAPAAPRSSRQRASA